MLTDSGRAWGFGANESGQLGVGDRLDRQSPERIRPRSSWREIQSFRAGERHTSFFVERSTGLFGNVGRLWVYTTGLGDNGRLGTGSTETQLRPTAVDDATELTVPSDPGDGTGPLSGSRVDVPAPDLWDLGEGPFGGE